MSSVWLTSNVWMVSSAEIVPNPLTFGYVSIQLNAPMATALVSETGTQSRASVEPTLVGTAYRFDASVGTTECAKRIRLIHSVDLTGASCRREC